MKILFSPSEAKSHIQNLLPINKDSFCCKELYDKRIEILTKYANILSSKNIETLKQIYGLKNEKMCLEMSKIDISSASTCKAIQRYNGVAYNYLDYESLSENQKNFIDENLVIFSNLFGPIFAKDNIPIYKLKQGSTLDGLKTEIFYKEFFTDSLNKIIKDEFIVDLRAGFYEKFYKIPFPHITMKFIKNEKVVSHWAKAYRGIVLRNLAINNIQTIDDFMKLKIDGLLLKEKLYKGIRTELIYDIVDYHKS